MDELVPIKFALDILQSYERAHESAGWLRLVIGVLHWAYYHCPGTTWPPVERAVRAWEKAQ